MENSKNVRFKIITIICFMGFLLFAQLPAIPVHAKIFFCVHPYEDNWIVDPTTGDPEFFPSIQTALDESMGNTENNIIIICPNWNEDGDEILPFDIDTTLLYLKRGRENSRLLIGGLAPCWRPILHGGNNSQIMILNTIASDINSDIYVANIAFKNGYAGEKFNLTSAGGLQIITDEADIHVANCLFEENITFNSLAAGAYLKTTDGGKIIAENNVFYRNENEHGESGCALSIEADDGVPGVHVINNFFHWNTSKSGNGSGLYFNYINSSGVWPGRNINIANNIFYRNPTSLGYEVDIEDGRDDLILNIYHNVVDKVRHKSVNYPLDEPWGNSYEAPRMTDMVSFSLEPDSPCIDTGSREPSHMPGYEIPVTDYAGLSRVLDGGIGIGCGIDRGPVEYRSSNTVTPCSSYYRFIPDIPRALENMKIPQGPPYYLQVGDIALNSDNTVGWTISNNREVPSGYTLYYGDPVTGNYHTDQKPNNGSFTIKNIDLKNSTEPKLSFLLYMDTEPGSNYDTLNVLVNGHRLWEKNDHNVGMKQWQLIEISLKDFTDKSIDIKVEFDTRDSKYNNTEGIYIDEFMIGK